MNQQNHQQNNPMSIDDKLNHPSQAWVQNMVNKLPDETPSLAWRSQLNERIRLEAKRRARKRFWTFALSPAAGLATVSALVALVWMPRTPQAESVATGSSVESAIVRAHQDEVLGVDVAGSSVSYTESARFASRVELPHPDEGSLIELESL